jgi:DNA segregation ATPase FtsK/SpoIIIE-like protein
MLTNVIAEPKTTTHDNRDFFLSEHLSDVERLHHEATHFDPALYQQAVQEVRRLNIASVNFLRRQLKLGYPQAAYFIQRMEDTGIIQRTEYRGRDSRRGWRYEVRDINSYDGI